MRRLRASALLLVCLSVMACGKDGAPADKTPSAPAAKQDPAEPPAKAAEPAKPADAVALPFASSYTGRVSLGAPEPGGTPPPHEGKVIRDQAGYEAFVGSIPDKVISMKQPSPPSDDPLLKKPAIDFEKHMLILATRHNMYVGPVIDKAKQRGDSVADTVTLPDPGDSKHMSARADIGTYHLVVVPAVPGEVTFEFVP